MSEPRPDLRPCTCGSTATYNHQKDLRLHEIVCFECEAFAWGETKEFAERSWNALMAPESSQDGAVGKEGRNEAV